MRSTRIIDPIRHGQISGERIHENKVKSLVRIFNYLHFHLLKALTNQNAFLLFLACHISSCNCHNKEKVKQAKKGALKN
jgi:hypothetical protein